MDGLILLVFLAVIVAYLLSRFRGRLGLASSASTWIGVIVVFVMVVLLLWVSGQGR
jgi:hypothetical protein